MSSSRGSQPVIKPKSQFRLGTEHEKFAFTRRGRRPVPYEGRRGIRALLEGMQHLLGWEPIIEDGNIIGLFDVTGGGAISLEPGGQFELSGAPLETRAPDRAELMAHLTQAKAIARAARHRLPRPRHDPALEPRRDIR